MPEGEAGKGSGAMAVAAVRRVDRGGGAAAAWAVLRRRGLAVEAVGDPCAVMVRLARGGATAVCVVEPRGRERVAELAAAVERYHAGTAVWKYEEAGARAVLSPLVEGWGAGEGGQAVGGRWRRRRSR